MSPVRALWRLVVGALLVGAVGGCASSSPDFPRDYKPRVARFFLEAATDGTPVALPQSDVRLLVNSQPVLTEVDILNVELVQVELGKCLLFQLGSSAQRDFYRLTATHQGRRIVLLVDGQPLGARRIDGPVTNGALFIFAELPEPELAPLVQDLKKGIVYVQRELARKK